MSEERSDKYNRILTLVDDLKTNSGVLVNQKVELAKAELDEKIEAQMQRLGAMAGGTVLAHIAVLFAAATVAAFTYYGLVSAEMSHMLAGAVAPLITSIILGIAAVITIRTAKSKLEDFDQTLKRTKRDLKEDKEWIRKHAS
ncbi:phage holin family protein [Oligoflexaceae bacterium]|nr:phage holin family protein [Oligoflexaceae bacterium]